VRGSARPQRLDFHIGVQVLGKGSKRRSVPVGRAAMRAVQEPLGHASIGARQLHTKLDNRHLVKVDDAAHPRARRRS